MHRYFEHTIWCVLYIGKSMVLSVYITLIIVTGVWKIDQIATLGLFLITVPANGYTCTLHIHSAITRLGLLVCFSRASLAGPVKSRL